EEIAIDVLPRLRLDAGAPRPSIDGRPALPGERERRLAVRVLEQRDAGRRQLEYRKLGIALAQQAVRRQLLDVAAHFRHTGVLEQAERAQLVMAGPGGRMPGLGPSEGPGV